jgi:membrane protease YdiL (CAAX protease family)
MMMVLKQIKPGKSLPIVQAILFIFGLLIFISSFQMKFPWSGFSMAGILLSVVVISMDVNSVKDYFIIFDLKTFSKYFFYFLAISILVGLFWGLVFRHYLNLQLIPAKLEYFTFTAMAIGSVEELIFRGYIQRKLQNLGIALSVVGASLMHTLYKCFIFLILPAVHQTDFFYLFVWTLSVGCISGTLKEFSGNTLVPVSGHAAFDLMVYGDGMVDTWWVWL